MCVKDFLRHRQVWLGIALIWVMLFHCPLDFGPFSYLTAIGYGGVDICLFASGIGCYYSLSSDPDIMRFMKRRIKRLAPTYLIFILLWLVLQCIIGNFNFQMAVGNILALQNFTGHDHAFNWYISAIFLLYLLAPYFKSIAEQATPVRKILFLIFLLICSIPFWKADTYIITVTRLPIFYIGMIFADHCRKNYRIGKKEAVILAIAFIAGVAILLSSYFFATPYLWSYGLYWYPFILITPPLCLGISYISMLLEKAKFTKPIVRVLSVCGNYSFEIYLVHIPLFSILSALIKRFDLSNFAYFIWVGAIALVAIGCYVLKYLTALLTRLFFPAKQTL